MSDLADSAGRQSERQTADRAGPASDRVIVFSKYPEPGYAKTRLIPCLGQGRAAKLQQHLSHHTFEVAREFCAGTGDRCWHVRFAGGSAEKMAAMFGDVVGRFLPQEGEGLGQRLQHATQAAFQDGVSKLLVIGTDCPAMSKDVLGRAFKKLSASDIVLGPALDGGYYLIGMRAPKPLLFENIAWGSDSVLKQTIAAAKRAKCNVVLLDPLADVDHPEDLIHCRKWLGSTGGVLPKIQPRHWSIVIPTLNEQAKLPATLARIPKSSEVQVVVADGGSEDDTVELARRWGAMVVQASPGRGRQMNAGAAVARGQRLMFLHADTRMPEGFLPAAEKVIESEAIAGCFELKIDGRETPLRWIERAVGWRSRHLQQPYGDQALFLAADDFFQIGGFPNWPLMEDIEIARRLRQLGRIEVVGLPAITSARRWQELGIARVTAINQLCRIGFAAGVSPERLAKFYRQAVRRSKETSGNV